jgi:hypothetical protein
MRPALSEWDETKPHQAMKIRPSLPRNLFSLALALAFSIGVGTSCGKKHSPPDPMPARSASAMPATEPVLTAWAQGDHAGAIKQFVETDWSAGPLFASNSALRLSETAFLEFPAAEREQRIAEVQPKLAELKHLASAVVESGRAAAARNEADLARKHFVALQQFGAALDTTNSLRLVNLVGQALQKLADRELANAGR